MITITGSNFIATTPSSKGNNTYQSINPKTAEHSTLSFIDATGQEINDALTQAQLAFKQIQTETIPLFLKQVCSEIMKLDNQLIETAEWETALGINRLHSERERTCIQLEKFAEYIQNEKHYDQTIERQVPIKSMNIALGPVLVFPASNFPFAFGVCGGDTASAWAAGCPVIVKAHPSHPQTSELFSYAVHQAIQKQKMPKGIFSMLHGKNPDVSQSLVLHPDIQAIGFTGSFDVGTTIYRLAASRKKPIPVYAEMGSINPIFIQNYQNNTADELANSITLGAGQFCTKPGVIFVTEDTKDIIMDIVKKIQEKKPAILLNENIKKRLSRMVNKTKNIQNVELITGGKEIPYMCSFEHTIFVTDSDTYLNTPTLQQEHFGPVAIFVTCKNKEEFITIARHLQGQLTASIYVDKSNIQAVQILFSELMTQVGRIIINGVPTGVSVCTAMNHGGPYPATTASQSTSVGMKAIRRFLRPICFQNVPDALVPKQLKQKN